MESVDNSMDSITRLMKVNILLLNLARNSSTCYRVLRDVLVLGKYSIR